MKKGGDIFKQYHDTFSQMKGHFHILEQRVPVELQMAYFKYSKDVREKNDPPRPIPEDVCEEMYDDLRGKALKMETEEKKYLLCQLATSKSIYAYRLLETYAEDPDPDVEPWAYMALMEARLVLESEFNEEQQIYVSTGLGGKGEKLRFAILLLSKDKKPFLEYQRQTIEREIRYYLPQMDCEIDRLTIGEQYVELLSLLPIRVDIRAMIDRVISECNQYGNFLESFFSITNLKEWTPEEISAIINGHGNN